MPDVNSSGISPFMASKPPHQLQYSSNAFWFLQRACLWHSGHHVPHHSDTPRTPPNYKCVQQNSLSIQLHRLLPLLTAGIFGRCRHWHLGLALD